ncbi:MFS transporter, DHA1 family, bicyclomycin/chloramphenicol resistance protein [Epibacterium ulvae]|uniref:Bcr/CflA family efflux transporter n=1 Tax=Epibacterium ulvae TaxID=1156985 RepID=A0A1G5QG07_9RHOB|nr:multidrug effflux MFS transporter [Epibacterium ulvae]SCZ60724.1 MFS transporter, DHA1 family, bicyclomycin/chloramphenicol resistance protein [Epibacterium ulvae]
MEQGKLKLALVLGLLTCLGPLAIDMYLPALPTIAQDLNTEIGTVQLTLTAYFLGFGLAQLIYGPIADQFGRKLPLFIGVAIFAAGSVLAAFAPSIEILIAARLLQALGGAALMVVPRAVVRDRYTGTDGAQLMGFMMMIVSVSPMLAPLAGSGVLRFAGWQGIFGTLAALAGLGLLMILALFQETLPTDKRVAFNRNSFVSGCKTLLADPEYLSLTFIGGFAMSSFFVFIASASFVYTGEFGLTPTGFGLAFALNGIGFFIATMISGKAGAALGMHRLVRLAVAGFVSLMLFLGACTLAGVTTLYLLAGVLFLGFFCLGLVVPTVMVLSLENHGAIAGLASSLGGTLQMLTGALMIALGSPFFDGSSLPMVTAMTISGVLGFALTQTKSIRLPNPVKT